MTFKETIRVADDKTDGRVAAMDRRDFLALGLALTAAALPAASRAAQAGGRARPAPARRPSLGRRKLGSLEVSALGLGCMSMTGHYNRRATSRK